MKVHHIGIWAIDMEETCSFYGERLGFEKEREYEVSAELMKQIFGTEKPCRIQVYKKGDTRVEIFDDGDKHQSVMNHFSISVGDRKKYFDDAKAKGADVIEVWRGDHPVYFLKDPAGTLIEIKD